MSKKRGLHDLYQQTLPFDDATHIACHDSAMPELSLPCYSVIYSVGINGGAGEVGTHVGFNPAAVGNLFLGMNAFHLAGNAGSFHVTVLIIPSGTFTGLWVAPEDGF